MQGHRRPGGETLRPVLWVPVIAALTVAGCAPGLAANPRYATDSGAHPEGQPQTVAAAPGPPPIDALKKDPLQWRDCTASTFGGAGVPAAPGVRLDCATFESDLDPVNGGSGDVSIGVVRATSPATPPNAGPIMLTTGTDLPSSVQLPVWLTRDGTDVLKTNPVIAIDRRGLGMSSPLDCRDLTDRQEMIDQAQYQAGDDTVANLASIAQNATTSCTDVIAPGDSAYDSAHAAEDLETLRSQWDTPTLALLGIGNGAQIALAYAASHPTKVSRLVLDSPMAPSVPAEAEAEQRAKGQQAALDAFATECVATNCPLAPDPKAAVDAVLAAARAGQAGGLSTAAVTTAISTALGYPNGDRAASVASLAGILAAARAGDTAGLTDLANRAQALQDTDGQFVGSCSDAVGKPTPDRVRELTVAWGKLYPQFGTVAALSLAECLNWPAGAPPKEPKDLKIPVLLLGVRNDPIIGNEGLAAVAATAINAGAQNRRVVWQGTGHGAVVYTACALPPVVGYLAGGKLPPTDTYCPA